MTSIAIVLAAAIAIIVTRRTAARGHSREQFADHMRPAMTAFLETQRMRKEESKHPSLHVRIFDCLRASGHEMPTDAAVKHYAAVARRHAMNDQQICAKILRHATL